MDPRQASAISFYRRKAQSEKDLAIEHNRHALAVDEAVDQPLVRAYLGADTRIFCVSCERFSGFRPSVPYYVEPDTNCAHCGAACGEVH
jgi:hypothetical protein